jgi:hypothetical protein
VQKLHSGGASLREIGATLGCSAATALRLLRQPAA